MPDFIEADALAAKRQTSREDLTIVDVRSPKAYAEGHVEGAINIPLADLEARVGEVPLGTEVVPYCNMYHSGSSRGEQAADVLRKLDFDAKTLLGGFPACVAQGFQSRRRQQLLPTARMTKTTEQSASGEMAIAPAKPEGNFLEVLTVFTKLGLTSFGGPIAHLGYFRAELVERRKWLDDQRYADLVALCQFLPGPASSQVGIGIGIARAGMPGGFAA